MSILNPTPEEKTSPIQEKTGREKTDKLWITAPAQPEAATLS